MKILIVVIVDILDGGNRNFVLVGCLCGKAGNDVGCG